MKRLVTCVITGFIAVSLSGCITAKKTTTTRSLDPKTNILTEVTVEESPSIFKSENQEMAFDAMDHKMDKAAEVKIKRLETMDKQMQFIATSSMPDEAKAFAYAMNMMVVGQIKDDTTVSDIPMPSSATDVILRNPYLITFGAGLIAESIGVSVPNLWGGGSGSGTNSSNEDMVVMGDYYFQSTRKDQYDLDAYALWQDQRSKTLTEDNDVSTDSDNTWGFGDDGSYNKEETDEANLL